MIPAVSRARLLQLALTAAGALRRRPAGGARTTARVAFTRQALGSQHRPAVPRRSPTLRKREPRRAGPRHRVRRVHALTAPGTVRLEAGPHGAAEAHDRLAHREGLRRGPPHALVAAEREDARRYLRDAAHRRGLGRQPEDAGREPPGEGLAVDHPGVVRVLGVEAAFDKRSYVPLEPARLTITADAESITLQFLACGTETEYTNRTDEMRGQPVGPALSFDWSHQRSGPHTITVNPGAWVSGVYAAKLTTDDGRVGFAPLILRPPALGTVREAVVMPTNTWQAYNFDDSDGDGWGDTWYAGGNPPVRLNRPYRQRGTPPWFRRSDVPFLKFLRRTGRTPDVLADDDLEAFPSGDELRRLYDLVVFPGHSEYVDRARVQRRPAVPRPRWPPDLPHGEQLLLEGGEERGMDEADQALAQRGPA